MTAVRRTLLVLLGIGFLVLPACSKSRSGFIAGPGIPAPSSLGLQTVASGLSFPVFLLSPPADTSRLFVVEKTGKVRIIKNGSLLATPFLDLSALVSTSTEQGLLGMAFQPDYAASGKFIVSYTDLGGNSRFVRYHVSGNPDVAVSTPDGVILGIAQPADNHNGGMIGFGPDGMLWIGMGDGGGGGDTYHTGQTKTDLLGSMLRIDVSGASGYTIPAGNPFTSPDRPEVWNIGLRNPWRWSFDRQTGDLYIADVGQSDREEIDVAPAPGRAAGANYGWPIMEGTACFPPGTGCSGAGLTPPVLDFDHANACAVTGGYVYRGAVMPGLSGTYFYSDYCGHWVRSFRLFGGVVSEQKDWPLLDPGAGVTSFGQDANGELYILTDAGDVYRIVAR